MKKEFKHSDVDKLCQYLGDDLSEEKCNEIRQEVNNCPDCNFILDEIRGTIELYRMAMPQAKIPPETIKRLRIKLQLPGD